MLSTEAAENERLSSPWGTIMPMKKLALVALACMILPAGQGMALAADRHVHIHNNTSLDIYEFHASNVGTSSYEEDILGDNVIASGDTWNINIDDGSGYCKFDFKAVFEDGSSATKDNVNVCKVSDFYFND